MSWTTETLICIHDLKAQGTLTYAEISETLLDQYGVYKSEDAIRRKHKRVDWVKFFQDPENYNAQSSAKKWTRDEILRLKAYLDAEMAISDMVQHFDRSMGSIEHKISSMDWEAWEEDTEEEEEKEQLLTLEVLTDALLSICRHDVKRLKELTEDDFLSKVNLNSDELEIPFEEVKENVYGQLDTLGLTKDSSLKLGEGRYMIVGDSHGKKTRQRMFDLISNVKKSLDINKIIHIGHMMDDDNEFNFNWDFIDDVIVVAKSEELSSLHHAFELSTYKARNPPEPFKYRKKYTPLILKHFVELGDGLVVMNQDLITDYVKTPIRSIEPEIFEDHVVFNCHRQEFFSKCSDGASDNFYCSPGSICEPHVIKTIRQINFQEGHTVKLAYHDGFQKYRRMEHMMKLWQQGIIIVDVAKDGSYTVTPCPIHKIADKNYALSYFDKIITSNGERKPEKKVFITADAHCPMHDPKVMDIQEQICLDYAPDVLVNIGDAHNFGGLNHHRMSRGEHIESDLIEESATTYHVLKLMGDWAKEKHILLGNHERFAKDFTNKMPQLSSLLNFNTLCNIDDLGYQVTGLQDILKIGNVSFIHGDMRMYGQNGSILEKSSRTFKTPVFVGHIHQPTMRFKALSIGFSGLLDQHYNEPNASAWMHGFGMCNFYKGFSFPTTVAISNSKKCNINGKNYSPSANYKKWLLKDFNFKLSFETQGDV